MAAKKYLELLTGRVAEKQATDSSAGAGNEGDLIALDAGGKINANMLPSGVGADLASIPAFENLSAGDFVNVFNDGGTVKMRKADATTSGKEADGFVLAVVTAPANGDCHFEGTNNQLSALTLGVRFYLNTTPGGVTDTPLTGSGNVSQYLGKGFSLTEISFEPAEGIIVA